MKKFLTPSTLQLISLAVITNAVFPPTATGRAENTIQDLIHKSSVESLSAYIDSLERNNRTTRADRARGIQEKKIGGLPASDVISALDNILNAKIAEEDNIKIAAEIQELEKELARTEPLPERREKIKKRLEALQGEA